MESSLNNTQIPHSYRFDPIYRFFCWCSGARLYLLKSCPTDYNKFFGIGIIVFLTGIMASLTGFYALYMIFNSLILSIFFGIFWGILIFFLDWYIVSSLRKEENILSELLFALPRIILAILLAVVISRPLELKLFEKEINAEIQQIHAKNSISFNQLSDNEFQEILILKTENDKYTGELKQKEELRNKLFNLMIEEAEGRSPTSRIGKGSVYKEKKAEYDKIDSELKDLKQNYNLIIQANHNKISNLEKIKQEQSSKSKSEIRQADGLLIRMEALSILADRNNTIKYAGWFIFILFVLIEASPILVKLLSSRGPYDELIEKEEFEKQIEYKKQKVKAKILANNYLELLKQKDELEIESERRNNEKLIKEIEIAKEEINKLAIGRWKQREIALINQELLKTTNEEQISDENPEGNDDKGDQSEVISEETLFNDKNQEK